MTSNSVCTKHMFQIYGKWSERCIKCSSEMPLVTAWRKQYISDLEKGKTKDHAPHPYIALGKWTLREYKKYMSQKR